MLAILPPPYDEDRELSASEADADRIVDAFMVPLRRLSEFEREVVRTKFDERLQLINTPRAGRTLAAVTIFFKEQRSAAKPLTVQQIRDAVTSQGVEATPKEIYNALGYLTRKRKVIRMGQGEYMATPPDFEPRVSQTDKD